MDERLHQAWEVQLDQLPQETEIYPYPGPFSPVFKKQGESWNPIDWAQQMGFEPLAEVEFPIGSIAIHPNGARYVKGHAVRDCPQHAMEIQCTCGRQLCWLRADSMNNMHQDHRPLLPGNAVAHVGGFGDSGGVATGAGPGIQPALDVHANLPEGELPNTGAMPGYPQGSDLPINIMRLDAPSAPLGGGSRWVGHTFNDSRVTSEHPPPDAAVHEVPTTAGPHRYTIHFNQQGGGIPLTLEGIKTLDGQSPSFEPHVSLGTKASIRFKFKCWKSMRHTDRRRQVNIRDSKENPFSFRKMAEIVFSELTEEMRTMAGLGYPQLSYGGKPVKVEDLALVRIERIKRGTLQPVFVLRPGVSGDSGRQM